MGVPVELELAHRQLWHGHVHVVEVILEPVLDALVCGAHAHAMVDQ
jgi:hypothetical protein